jgi:membrane protease YdiL (CAAX protease family)
MNTLKSEEVLEIKKISSRNSILLLTFIIINEIGLYVLSLVIKKNILNLKPENMQTAWIFLAYSLQYLVTIPLILVLFRKNKNIEKPFNWFKKPNCSLLYILKWSVMGYSIIQISNIFFKGIFYLLEKIFKVEFFSPVFELNGDLKHTLVVMLALVVYAPIFEEILFRGKMLSDTVKYGSAFAIIIVGLYFGLFHKNYEQIFYAWVAGMIFAYLAIKTQSIIPSIIMHFLFNGSSAVVLFVTKGIDITKIDEISFFTENLFVGLFLFGYGMFSLIIMVTGFVLFIIEIFYKKEEINKNESKEKRKCLLSKLRVYFSTPITIVMLIILVSITIVNMLGNGEIYI